VKQLVQNYKTGELALKDVPPPRLRRGGVLVRTHYSLVSAGTERGQIEFGRKSLVGKALARPDLVAKVLAKARTEGPLAALEKALRRLEQPLALGYSCSGIVDSVSDDVRDIAPGDLVACAGLGFASHAQVTFVPRNLCVRVPPGVDLAEAAYVTLGAIAIEGTRVAEVRLGESVGVIGLGLLGLLTVQVLKANGCRVFGIDPDPARLRLASECGADVALLRNAEDLEQQVLAFTSGSGMDTVIVTAATASSDPLELAAAVARDRACVAVVGITGMRVPRKAFYEKALELRMSRGYGPGRYDRTYEERGIDYPIGYVRWTENRNMQAFLQLLTERRVDVRRLTTHTFPIEHALKAYDLILGQKERHVGVMLEYDQDSSIASRVTISPPSNKRARTGTPRVGVIGAGAFATGTLIPALLKSGVHLRGIVTQTGLTAEGAATRFGFEYCASDPREVLDDQETDAVVIVTRPDSHAELTVRALEQGKDVFIEKPLSTELEHLKRVWAALRAATDAHFMVGFNRRYAPFSLKLREFFAPHTGTLLMTYRVNAPSLARGHWQLDQEQGGGRLVAECGHFIDLMAFVAGESPTQVSATAAGGEDVAVTVRFDRGSVGSLSYTASGSEAFPKERLEVFGDGRVGVLDDFRRVELVVGGRSQRFANRLGQDKGHEGEMRAFAAALRGTADAIPDGAAAVLTTLATLQAALSLRTGLPQPVTISLLD
jgi:predicted dehydrogenase/threonine dehydrogenase-like Zn-dependent dehydrogenase